MLMLLKFMSCELVICAGKSNNRDIYYVLTKKVFHFGSRHSADSAAIGYFFARGH